MNIFEQQAIADRAAYRKGAEMTAEIPTPTPRTDAHYGLSGDSQGRGAVLDIAHALALERDLAAMERRALECVAMNERQAVNFAKCQADLARAVELLRDASLDCGCSIPERNSGHRIGCFGPAITDFLTELESK